MYIIWEKFDDTEETWMIVDCLWNEKSAREKLELLTKQEETNYKDYLLTKEI